MTNDGTNMKVFADFLGNSWINLPEFYNPKTSCITFKITNLSSLNLSICETLDPNATGRVKKGEKRYDRQNSRSFTLTLDEVIELNQNLPKVLNGTYVNNSPNVPENNRAKLVFTHFNEHNHPSFCTFDKVDSGGKSSIRVYINPCQETGLKGSYYIFRQNELLRFKLFIDSLSKHGDLIVCMFEAIKNHFKNILFKMGVYSNSNTSGGNYNNNGGNRSTTNSYYNSNQSPSPNTTAVPPMNNAPNQQPQPTQQDSNDLFGNNDNNMMSTVVGEDDIFGDLM